MDPLLELFAKGGLALLAGFIIAKWLAAAVQKLWEKSEERAKDSEQRCDEANKLLTKRVQELENRQYDIFSEILRNSSEALVTNARAFDKLTDIGTDKFRAIQKERA
jgi:hypothetical protein